MDLRRAVFTEDIDRLQLYRIVSREFPHMDDMQVAQMIKRCLAEHIPLLQYLQPAMLQQKKIGIHTIEGIDFVNAEDIIFVQAKGNYTELKLSSGSIITSSRKLGGISNSLPEQQFLRIHHSYIVNLQYIRKYYKGRGGYLLLDDQTTLPVSVRKKDAFLKRFE